MITKEIVYDKLKLLAKENIFIYHFEYDSINKEAVYRLFVEIFNTAPIYSCIFTNKSINTIDYNKDLAPEKSSLSEQGVDVFKTYQNILKTCKGSFVINAPTIDILFGDRFIVVGSSIYSLNEKILEKIKKNIIFKEHAIIPHINWVTFTGKDFKAAFREINNVEYNSDNYNNDIPIDQIESELNSNNSSLILFHGEPGTGKTTFIRSLICKYCNKNFYYIDGRSLYGGDTSSLASLFINTKNGIFIIEDCENLLSSRDTGNTVLSTLLNITDGMLGDSLGLKFICTFNTNVENLDQALLRKGRLKLKYEFKKLSKDKVSKLFDKLDIDENPTEMTVCDVYNYKLDNGNKAKQKIGF